MGRVDLEAWVLDWLRLVFYTPGVVTVRSAVVASERAMNAFAAYDYVSGALHTAEAAVAYASLPVRAAGGWVDRATLEHVQWLVSRALERTEAVREARRGLDLLGSCLVRTVWRRQVIANAAAQAAGEEIHSGGRPSPVMRC